MLRTFLLLTSDFLLQVVGASNVLEPKPTVASEDISYMLRERPGCFIWLGNKSERCKSNLHECTYDFNDDVLPIGASLFVALVEELQPPL